MFVPRCVEATVLDLRWVLDWRLVRVYFLAFLNSSRGQPDPALTTGLVSPGNRR
jgi:hypothetical protein